MDNLITWLTWAMPALVVVLTISQWLIIRKDRKSISKKIQYCKMDVLTAACISGWHPEVIKVAYMNGGNTSDPVDEEEVMDAGRIIAASAAYRKLVNETLQSCLKDGE